MISLKSMRQDGARSTARPRIAGAWMAAMHWKRAGQAGDCPTGLESPNREGLPKLARTIPVYGSPGIIDLIATRREPPNRHTGRSSDLDDCRGRTLDLAYAAG